MITKLDRAVARYLTALNARRPNGKDELACCAWSDGLDRARYRLLDELIRKARYRGLTSRRAWLASNNPHRPPYA